MNKDFRILVVEDDGQLRNILDLMLTKAGFLTVTVATVNAAVKELKTTRVDLVLTDLLMPDSDGIELIRHIKKNFPALHIVAMSGGSPNLESNQILKMASVLGAERIISKPFLQAELIQTIEGVLVD